MPDVSKFASDGLFNIDAPDYGALASAANDRKIVTYCNATCAIHSSQKNGRLVAFKLVDRCPKCGDQTSLFHTQVTHERFRQLQQIKGVE
jgi:hypothetical protein